MLNATKTHDWLRYWRNSLADADSGKGILKKEDLSLHLSIDESLFQAGKLGHALDDVINKLFKNESDKTQLVKVIIRPAIYLSRYEHGKKRNNTHAISPIICQVWLSRSGWFYPADKPTVPRDLLNPQADNRFTLFDVDLLDEFHTTNETIAFSEDEAQALVKHEGNVNKCFMNWETYHTNFSELYAEIDKEKIEEGFTLVNKKDPIYLIKTQDAVGFTRHVLNLYDWLIDEELPPLIENYALGQVEVHSPCKDSSKAISIRLAHSNSKFPLSTEQKDALTQVIGMREGEILAINGPPGTGKTTLVLSVVASLWVRAALDESDPPLIIAASTNNQAVTNIIDAFGKDFEENEGVFSGRWLPKIKSYGGYFPSFTIEKNVSSLYHTPLFYEGLEQSEYLNNAESKFIEKANSAFKDKLFVNTKLLKNELLTIINDDYHQLNQFQMDWHELENAKNQCFEKYSCSVDQSITLFKTKKSQLDTLSNENKKWQRYLANESIWLTLFSWLPPVKRKLYALRDVFIEDEFNEITQSLVKDNPRNKELLLKWLSTQQQDCDKHERDNKGWLLTQSNWRKLIKKLPLDFPELLTKEEYINLDRNNISNVDKLLDTTLRFKLFQLTVHYWEARWLLECRKLEKKSKGDTNWANPQKTGASSVKPRWRRRMMLTPCIVSTLHSLPSHMTHEKFITKNNYQGEYLSNEVDLLIIDEAGQVAPDIAAASLALAKKALVIGDIHQIEPIQSLTPSVDIGNLIKNHLIKNKTQYPEINKTGATVTEGCVMKIAQRTSLYHYQQKAEFGMFLREHRRCYDEIISYSNELCYQGLLKPKRGIVPDEALFPPTGYVHVDGCAEVSSTGSRSNPLEATQVARWLKENRGSIESYYQQQDDYSNCRLEDLVGVVTPFAAQKKLIEHACENHSIKVGKSGLTIGTVHALQGAERPLIIFSAVYSRHSDGGFIDMSPSMLNVAVSRAKDSFIVFGDMDVISGSSVGTPRNLLAQYLFKSDSNEIVFQLGNRPDLLQFCASPKVINNAMEHDSHLKQLLDETTKKISIVSPWVSLSKLQESGIYEKMVSAVSRGVKVYFYSDKHFNTTSMNQCNKKKYATFKYCCETLESAGISVLIVNGVHSKLVMSDNTFFIVGSYNWGSAARTGKYSNLETSIIYKGNLEEEITLQIKLLKSKLVNL